MKVGGEVIIEAERLGDLFGVMAVAGYQTLGPTVCDGAIVYGKVASVSDLPVGWHDFQDAGSYRLSKDDPLTFFGYVLGSHSWKRYLHPSKIQLWRANRGNNGFRVVEQKKAYRKYALIGVRACELHAIAIQDKVFNTAQFLDPIYHARRDKALIVAVNCTRPGGTCFCVSMNTGPKATSGYDIALTEVLQDGKHYFLGEVGSKRGAQMLMKTNPRDASDEERSVAQGLLVEAARHMGRSMNTANLKKIFYENFDHSYWKEVAGRCLTCGNCTMVCPTCFCTDVEEVNALSGEYAERWRRWDSCFTQGFSYIHGGSVRASERSRYRQWLTHKLATWKDQFGTLGCVGCGRCITWCPVGIDITEEAKAILR